MKKTKIKRVKKSKELEREFKRGFELGVRAGEREQQRKIKDALGFLFELSNGTN